MRPFPSILFALQLLIPAVGARAANPPAVLLHVGPVFTQSGKAGSYPQYPDLQIQVEVPPGTDPKLLIPGAFFLSVDGGAAIGATNSQTLASTGYGIAATFALDVSGSMRGAPLDAVRSGLTKFVGDAGPQDKIAIETIADDGRWDTSWDDSRDQARAALAKLAARGSLTRLWDGLLQATQRYPDTPLSLRLIVISDGHDEGSVHHEEEIIAAAREHGIVIDAIGMTRSSPMYLQTLNRLATETGGVYRRARDTAELEALIGHGVERLKATPVIRYRIDGLQADGDFHRFAVTWKHDGAESQAEITATLPKNTSTRKRISWAVGLAVLFLLLGGVLLAATRKRKQPGQSMQPVASPPPVAVVPASQNRASGRGSTIAQLPSGKAPFTPVEAPPPAAAVMPRPHPKRASTEILARFSAPSPEQPGAWLFCEQGACAGQRYALHEAVCWIGALANNHLRLSEDLTVSGNHACVAFDHDLLSVYDNNSTNGTWVNADKISGTRRVLRPDDRIRIGQSTFVVKASAGQSEGA